ncbi:MAG: sugar transferase [Chloroflexi bacterium]|nr:sugar transferase [Chloroflexota bacterium]
MLHRAVAQGWAPIEKRLLPALPKLHLTPSERRLILVATDVAVISLGLLAALALRGMSPFSPQTLLEAPRYFLLLSLVWAIWATFFECYDLPRSARAGQSAWGAGRASLATALTYLAIPVLTPHLLVSRFSALLFVALLTVGMLVWRTFYATVLTQPGFKQRVLMVGAGPQARQLAHVLASVPSVGNPYAGSGFELVGIVNGHHVAASAEMADTPVLGGYGDLAALVEKHDIDLVVLATQPRGRAERRLLPVILDCREQGISVESAASLYERLTGKVLLDGAASDFGALLSEADWPILRMFSAAKRLFDVIIACFGLLVVLAAAPMVAVANACTSPGPLFFRQRRLGKGGKPFDMVKFRSMVPGAERQSGAVWAAKGDSRVTPMGRFLRAARLDELPQFWNILKGEMSLIGPRPERPEFIEELVEAVPFYQARHAVRPGLTGWAQVRHGYGSSVEDARIKLQHDLYYIRHMGVYIELSIMVKTAAVMLGLRGR